ncbi:MAG TPA: hypothetical protein VNO32_19820, partial [Candidatus Acidoferrum sp.]|nr:hypothetical protein [Candidatus Acidoferrum sp.]
AIRSSLGHATLSRDGPPQSSATAVQGRSSAASSQHIWEEEDRFFAKRSQKSALFSMAAIRKDLQEELCAYHHV